MSFAILKFYLATLAFTALQEVMKRPQRVEYIKLLKYYFTRYISID